jgi:hypothetical protein
LVLLAGCATGPPKTDVAAEPETAAITQRPERGALSVAAGDIDSVAREAAAALAGGLAVMNGMGERETPALEFRNASIREVAERLAQETDGALAEQGAYVLLYPGGPGYESLLALDVGGQLHPRFRGATVALEFASETTLYTLCCVLSQSMGATVVADNMLAETHVGLLSLPAMPFADALKAVLQSARVDPAVLGVKSTEEYVFLYVPKQGEPTDLLLNRDALTEAEREHLSRRVTLVLPEPAPDRQHVTRYAGARPLGALLPALSAQLGMDVTIESRFREIPINPVVMNNVTVETALDLLIRQWPVPVFGYEVRGRSVLIRRR